MASTRVKVAPAGTEVRQLALVGDSISFATQAGTEYSNFTRYGDLLARALKGWGVNRYSTDWGNSFGVWQNGTTPRDLVYRDLASSGYSSGMWPAGVKGRSVPRETFGAAMTVTGVTNEAYPVVTTSTDHGLASGDIVEISGVGGATGVNNVFAVRVASSTTFRLYNAGGVSPGTYTSGGTAYRARYTPAVDFLLVQFGTNESNAGAPLPYDGSNYQAALRGLLDAWPNARRKYVFQSWVPSTGATATTQGRQDYHDAVIAAAAAATPGVDQSAAVGAVFDRGTGTSVTPPAGLTYDGTHANAAGFAALFNAIWPAVWADLYT